MSEIAAVDVICAKRDHHELNDEQITWILNNYVKGAVAEEQMSALLMAILLNGMTSNELAKWTAVMIDSGERLDLSSLSRPTVDKHSTGGVGDKISLILAPLVAACGAAVPQLSGRGLGHTGGTLDKLEAITNWRAVLSNDEILSQLDTVGAVICAAGEGLAPADRKLYSLRDVTGTVESVPLISASIMSKKIAEGTASLVLDVKVGRGAFMKDLDRARELARTMVALGERHGVATVAQLTAMDAPLGRAAGNALEVSESVDVLRGGGPPDIRDLTLALAREMVSLAGLSVDPETKLNDGSAYRVYCEMIRAQGGDPDEEMPLATQRELVLAQRDGYVQQIDAMTVGVAAWRLGAGRARKEDAVSKAAGVLTLVREGDYVHAGEPLFELHADDTEHLAIGRRAIDGAALIGDEAPEVRSVLLDRISSP
jgi:thymidine phosphorylase